MAGKIDETPERGRTTIGKKKQARARVRIVVRRACKKPSPLEQDTDRATAQAVESETNETRRRLTRHLHSI